MLSTVKFCFTTIDPRREKDSMSAQRTTAAAAIIKCLCRKDFASRSFPGSVTRYRSQLMMPFSPETPKSHQVIRVRRRHPKPTWRSDLAAMGRPKRQADYSAAIMLLLLIRILSLLLSRGCQQQRSRQPLSSKGPSCLPPALPLLCSRVANVPENQKFLELASQREPASMNVP